MSHGWSQECICHWSWEGFSSIFENIVRQVSCNSENSRNSDSRNNQTHAHPSREVQNENGEQMQSRELESNVHQLTNCCKNSSQSTNKQPSLTKEGIEWKLRVSSNKKQVSMSCFADFFWYSQYFPAYDSSATLMMLTILKMQKKKSFDVAYANSELNKEVYELTQIRSTI
ncbi:uncharacterized protein LOC132051604 isoform X3 [Lycium ferocissimum]|uniref:uncharacterized protein LOC132051604 isoform X3 n=1 Tax=Lycium ferocissimum TaxID=112874 RepID=UPI002815F2E9|nr:uncharacterized protein LOC132051604 isoform X3 [Lycium ferocissimum]